MKKNTKLSPEIIEKIKSKTGLSENTIRKEISLLRRKYPSCSINAVAQLYATKHGISVMQKLSKEDKETLPNHDVEKAVVKMKARKSKQKEKIVELIKFVTTEPFRKGHIDEVNKAYTKGCYTSAYILARKVIENFILDIMQKKFPEKTSQANKELYYDVSRRRFKDFEIILKNLYDRRHDFNVNSVKPIQRLYEKAKNFKDRANDVTHSWFYLITNKKEIDDLNLQEMIDLINQIVKEN